MNTQLFRKISSSVLGVSLLLQTVPFVRAETGDTVEFSGTGTLTIIQEGPVEQPELIGKWTLFQPGNSQFVAPDKSFTFTAMAAGNYTFTSDIPQGTTASIEIQTDGVTTLSASRQQVTFPLNGNQNVVLTISYAFTRVGTVAVNSKPAGMTYMMKGPNDFVAHGKTPEDYQTMPEGLYTVYFDPIPGCITPKPKSDKLLKDGRIALTIEVACEALKDTSLSKEEQTTLDYITVTIDGKALTFMDAKTSEWYSTYVAKVVKTGIMGGYSDTKGDPTGMFGPGDPVTLAQLSKIAHRIAAIDETKVQVPVRNAKAQNQWFEQFFASAEQNWWAAYRDNRQDPSRPATRAEVVATLLQALDVPRVWPKGKTYGDVQPNMPYADTIETAAADGLLDTEMTSFRPNDPINRAEMAKLLTLASQIYIDTTANIQGGSY